MKNKAALMLKAAIDFNSEIMILATQLMALDTKINPKTVEEAVDQSVKRYQETLKTLINMKEKPSVLRLDK